MTFFSFVMTGLDPVIQKLRDLSRWITGSSPAMTVAGCARSRIKSGMTVLAASMVATAAHAHDTSTYSVNKTEVNSQASSDAGVGGYYSILPEEEVQGVDGERMIAFFVEIDELPIRGMFDDATLIAHCMARQPFVASLPGAGGADPGERLFGLGAVRNRNDGSLKADRALLAVWRIKEGCELD
jgi:hypothetical protein